MASKKAKANRLLDELDGHTENRQKVLADLALDRERVRSAALRAKYKETRARLETCELELAALLGLGQPKPIKVPRPPPEARGNAAGIVVLGDWHAEEDVDPATINNLNEYNLDIFARRCDTAFQNAVRMFEVARRLSDIDEVVVAVLGDLINGYIHPEMEESNLLGPMQAMLLVKDKLAGGIEYLVDNLPDIERFRVCCCYGNHGRTTEKRRISTARRTNLEWALFKMMRDWAHDTFDGVEWEVAEGAHLYADIKGHAVRLHHGSGIRYQGGVGGISIPLNKAIASWNEGRRADLDILGHWHQFARLQNDKAVLCGSLD
jgi:hypothetical protein